MKNYVYGLALKVFESPKFGQLWDLLNRHSHDAVINILTGKKSPLQERIDQGGKIVVNLTPALNNLIEKANQHGVTLFNPLKSDPDHGQQPRRHDRLAAAGLEVLRLLQPHREAEVGDPGHRAGPGPHRHRDRGRPPQGPAADGDRHRAGDVGVAGRAVARAHHLPQPGLRAPFRHARWRAPCGTPCCAS